MAMTVVVEKITPAKATRMLNKNKDNRKLRSGVVEKYTFDMKNGGWTTCPEPISFYENGDVADGQHRLWAIIESGTTQEFIVVRGLEKKDGLNINVGVPRNLIDNARISGLNADLSHRLVAVARAVETGRRTSNSSNGTSNTYKLAVVEKHDTAARWAIANGPTQRQFSHSLVLAAIARAWYYESDKARLAQFGEVMGSGFMADDADSAAIAMRNAMLNHTHGFSHPDVWEDTFLKAQNAIKNFMRRKKVTMIKSLKDEAYPSPTAAQMKKVA